MTRTLTVGIASYEDMKERTMAIARGERRPAKDEPTIWFTSLESFAKILSARNQTLLELIADREPASLAELEVLSGRARSNLSRTLKTMERHGLIQLSKGDNRTLVPRVPFDRIRLEMPLHPARAA